MADAPETFLGVTVSSTFTDLAAHRRELIEVISKFGLMPVVMEHDGARVDANVLESSLEFVRKAAAYVGLISHRYGQIPPCPDRNPTDVSVTELEFNEAMRLGRPILLFFMADDHPVTLADVEQDPAKVAKLKAFKERAKQMGPDKKVHRVYETFDSVEDFAKKAAVAIGRLAAYLKREVPGPAAPAVDTAKGDSAPLELPPKLRAVPRYLASHAFVGRRSELETLDEWVGPSDPNPVLLFEAIGGSGKSRLTWEWVTQRAPLVRDDLAGRFWYSFYERGALMSDFCRQALSYVTGRPVDEFSKMRTRELADRLMAELERKPWLLVLDGLERVLVAYHRIDAPQLRDEEVDTAKDQIGKRNPCAAINPEDDALLRRLAAVAPSKVLVTTRLMPRALDNGAGGTVLGVRREILSGLRPADAEKLMRDFKVRGQSKELRAYLQANCDCHPLVIRALAGLVNYYPPDRGNFDAWVKDPDFGGSLNLAELDLTQRRSHILDEAISALSPEGQQLLETLALLSGGADFEVLKALNPHLPPQPEKVDEPDDPEKWPFWSDLNKEYRAKRTEKFSEQSKAYADYLAALAAWRADPVVRAAPARLNGTLRDLEARGLLQYEPGAHLYDLHPVVRGVTMGRMDAGKKQDRGQRVVDYFNTQMKEAWDDAEDIEELASAFQRVTTLTQMGRFKAAWNILGPDGLLRALEFNFEAHAKVLALLKPFFPFGWDADTLSLDGSDVSFLLGAAANALSFFDTAQSLRLRERECELDVARCDNVAVLGTTLRNLANQLENNLRMPDAERIHLLALDLGLATGDDAGVFVSRSSLFDHASIAGNFARADRLWAELDPMGRNWPRWYYRPGDAELHLAGDRFQRGSLTFEQLRDAEAIARDGRNRSGVRWSIELRGRLHLQRNEAAEAAECLAEAVRMAHESSIEDAEAEALLALARLRAGDAALARSEAERLDGYGGEAALSVAEIWRALGEPGLAIAAALRAHEWAVGNGEPYVWRYELDRARALLTELGAELPDIPVWDKASAKIYPWEADVRALIDKLNAEKAEKAGKRRLRRKPDNAASVG